MGKEVKPGVVLVIAILCIAIIGPLCFWLGKQFSNKEDVKDEKKEETKEVANTWVAKNKAMSIGYKNSDIVIIKEDGSEIIIDTKDLNSNTELFYDDGKVYTFDFGKDGGKSQLGYFDLNDNNKFVAVAEFARKTIPESIIVLNDHAYISLAGQKAIIDYDFKEKESTELFYFDDYFSRAGHGSFLLYAVDGQAYYLTRGTVNEEPEFGSIDLETGKKVKITDVGYVNYIHDGKFVFNHDAYEGDKYTTVFYEYDTNTKKVSVISGTHADIGGSIDDTLIIPVDDYYIYSTVDGIYKYQDGKEEKLVSLEDNYFGTFVKTSSNTALLIDNGPCGTPECADIDRYLIYDIKDKEVKKTSDYDDVYYSKMTYLN